MKALTFTTETQSRRGSLLSCLFLLSLCLYASVVQTAAQEKPPAPSAAKAVTVPPVKESKLSNGMTVAVVERRSTPIVTIQMLIKAGAASEPADKAGLADITASMLTKGTATRSATQIAEAIEYLGGSIETGAGWNSSFISVTVTSDKVDQAMAVLADVYLHPKFDDSELQLLKSQTLDELTLQLKSPGPLTSFVASRYSFGEHPAGGTPKSIASMTANDIRRFYRDFYLPSSSVLIFAGDITASAARDLSLKYLDAGTKGGGIGNGPGRIADLELDPMPPMSNTILVIDLPKSGQAAVAYTRKLSDIGRKGNNFYSASVLNSVLGGGYSSRLNYEIRIKRGLSYGAGSNIAWRADKSNFIARAQTKNESAAEVAQLMLAEVQRLADSLAGTDEMTPRRSVLTGNFGRNLERTTGLASAVGELYSFGIPASELNNYVAAVNAVSPQQVKSFATANLLKGQIIIAGDYSVFKDDLAKRFPTMKVRVVEADKLDLSTDNLQK